MAGDARGQAEDRSAAPGLRGTAAAALRPPRPALSAARPEAVAWLDGRLVPRDAPGLPPDDLAYRSGRGCYTTARWSCGRPRFGTRSARRLARDAARLELGPVDVEGCLAAMGELGEAAFGEAEGVLRFQASRDGAGRSHLVGLARALGAEPEGWRVVSAPFPHPGPAPWGGAKVTGELRLELARQHAASLGADEALLFDAAGYLIEGARSSVFLQDAKGELATPDLGRGGVAGITREILCEALPALRCRDLRREELGEAREILVGNAVRGVRPVLELDGVAVGDGRPGPAAALLADALAAAEACATEEGKGGRA